MWPFRRRTQDEGERTPTAIEAITAETPRRFTVALAEPRTADRAAEVLDVRLGNELSAVTRRDDAGRVVLDITSTFAGGNAVVLRPLNQLQRAGVEVTGITLHGLITDVDNDALGRAVAEWAANANIGPYRKRLEHLAGEDLLQRCVAAARAPAQDQPRLRSAWWLAVRCVVFNTPGAEGWAVSEAAREPDETVARSLIDAALDRVSLVRLAAMEASIPVDALAELLHRPGYLAERGCHLVQAMRAHVDPTIAHALQDLVPRGGEAAQAAMAALHEAEPSAELRATVDHAFASEEPEVRASALALLARHWPADARPVWRDFLASRSAPLRLTAESVMGQYGDARDLPDAAAQLARLSRGAGTESSPPRGHEIVELLVRHRDDPVARGALDGLTAGWPRLRADLRRWLEQEHAELAPRPEAPAPASVQEESEEELAWPPPRMARDGDELAVTFDEAPSHAPARDRFEELVERDGFEVLESDRDFLVLRARAEGAEQRLRDLWTEASRRGDD